ncbi:atrial natriuretic peptide receptor A, partial [Mytilus galloprovincialis]
MAASWNILMLVTVGTDAMFDVQEDFPTLVRTSVSVNKFSLFYVEFFAHFSWTDIAVIYDQNAIYCPRWQEGLELVLATNGYQVTPWRYRICMTQITYFMDSQSMSISMLLKKYDFTPGPDKRAHWRTGAGSNTLIVRSLIVEKNVTVQKMFTYAGGERELYLIDCFIKNHNLTNFFHRKGVERVSSSLETELSKEIIVGCTSENIPQPSQCRIHKFFLIGDLTCQNLVKFVGLYPFEKCIYRVTEYCSRGSLQDIVQNDSINLDWDFKVALLTDLTNGMAFLHDSHFLVHGRLNSERCVIDSRFVLKITGYGLNFIRVSTYAHFDNQCLFEYLWFAPEVLRGKCNVSQAADVYSYSIIMFEVLTRMAPFELDLDLLTVKEIVSKLRDEGLQQPFRPTMPGDVEKPAIIELMKECWGETVSDRPTFKAIKKQLKALTGVRISSSNNILDSLLRRMEQYANNLEDLVSQRTDALIEEKRKSEALLDQVLPRRHSKLIPTKLKNGLPVDPEAYQCVTIYFSDIVGFTAISAQSSAIEVVDLLNDLYTMFDSIIDIFEVYKVETIGDAYMVVSGLPTRNGNDHVKQIAQMSLAILKEIGNFKIRHLPAITLEARIGLHSGPVCAGVVGKKMPRYCLFGDTVNTASRMESHGQAMKIHVSPQSKLLLDSFGLFSLESRGAVQIKIKPPMRGLRIRFSQ